MECSLNRNNNSVSRARAHELHLVDMLGGVGRVVVGEHRAPLSVALKAHIFFVFVVLAS